MASEKTRAGVLRPRRADYEFLSTLAASWGVPRTEALRAVIEHFCHCQAEEDLADSYWTELQPAFDRRPRRPR